MLNKYRLIVKIKKQYMYVSKTSLSIKEDVLNYNDFKDCQFVLAMPESFMMESKNNKIKKENLVGICYIDLKEAVDDDFLKEITEKLTATSFFEYIQILPEHVPEPPSDRIVNQCNTPDFLPLQVYKNGDGRDCSNSDAGIDIEYAWSLGITGQRVRIADIEWGFDFKHVDLERDMFVELIPLSVNTYNSHGTMVAGVLYAKDNSCGIKGMVHNADVLYGVSEFIDGRPMRATNIALGLEKLRAGDVFLLEMQWPDAQGNGIPPDYEQPVWDVVKSATDAGIIIVMTAGNGNINLDTDLYSEYRNRGDNGAILLGAGTKIGRNRASFSTYGKMVHVQGWGDHSVVTTGGGDLYDSEPKGHNDYTSTFSGTSSAGAIVTAAVVAIQSWYKKETNNVLSPLEMRKLLIETGAPQGNKVDGHIGPLPNVRNAIEKLKRTISYIHVTNKNNISDNEFNNLFRDHDVIVVNLGDGSWSSNIYLPEATIMHEGKRVYINTNTIYGIDAFFNSTSVALARGESISFRATDNKWIITDSTL